MTRLSTGGLPRCRQAKGDDAQAWQAQSCWLAYSESEVSCVKASCIDATPSVLSMILCPSWHVRKFI